MIDVEIKRATIADLETIQRIGKQTFLEAFASANTEEDIHQYVTDSFSRDRLSKEVNHPGSEFYIVYAEGQVVGYLKVNHGSAQTESSIENAMEIERIYVTQPYYGKQIGQLLFNKALSLARMRNASCLWLGVWEKNLRAIRFYEKHGFVAFDTHSFLLGNDLQTDLLMKLELTTT